MLARQRNDFIVTGHHCHRAELQAFRQMHSADRDMAAVHLNLDIDFRCASEGIQDWVVVQARQEGWQHVVHEVDSKPCH